MWPPCVWCFVAVAIVAVVDNVVVFCDDGWWFVVLAADGDDGPDRQATLVPLNAVATVALLWQTIVLDFGLSEPDECDRYGLPRIVAEWRGFVDRAHEIILLSLTEQL